MAVLERNSRNRANASVQIWRHNQSSQPDLVTGVSPAATSGPLAPGGLVPNVPHSPTFRAFVDVALNADGRAEAFFATDNDGTAKVYFQWQTSPGSTNWFKSYHRLKAGINNLTTPNMVRVARTSDGRLVVFQAGPSQRVHLTQQQAPSSGPWTDWRDDDDHNVGTYLSPQVGRDGLITVFACGNHLIWASKERRAQNRSNFSSNRQVAQLANAHFVAVESGVNQDGRQEVFAINNTDKAIYHAWEESVGGNWHALQPLGNLRDVTHVDVASNTDGRLEVFALTNDRTLHNIWQNAANSGWSNWNVLGKATAGGPVQVLQGDGGRLVVFAQTDKGLSYWYQDRASAGPWHGPIVAVPGPAMMNYRVFRNHNNILELIVIKGFKYALHAWQTATALNSPWTALQAMWPQSGAPIN